MKFLVSSALLLALTASPSQAFFFANSAVSNPTVAAQATKTGPTKITTVSPATTASPTTNVSPKMESSTQDQPKEEPKPVQPPIRSNERWFENPYGNEAMSVGMVGRPYDVFPETSTKPSVATPQETTMKQKATSSPDKWYYDAYGNEAMKVGMGKPYDSH